MACVKQLHTAAFLKVLILVLLSGRLGAETGQYNIHLEAGPGFPLTGWQADDLGIGAFGAGRFEYCLSSFMGIELGISYLQFFKGGHPDGYRQIDSAYWYNGAAGVRFRLNNDETGYKWPWKSKPNHVGNFFGNLWLDVHADYYYTGEFNRFGADAGMGVEFSVINALQIGPFARGKFVFQPNSENERNSEDAWILLVGLSFSLELPPEGKTLGDDDADTIYNPDDQCPDNPEDRDGFEDADGCPDEDNDGDGVPDDRDNCPFSKEDQDGTEDEDGCPELDNDGDKIKDAEDDCPNDREDLDDFEDIDGCPEPDNDNDELIDSIDQCPNDPETVNGIDDEDGCPEPDKDDDGFVDVIDQCPSEPETVNGIDDEDGCPDEGLVEVDADHILIGKRILFDFGMIRIKTRGREVLTHLAKLIRRHPEYILVSIEGHADLTGDAEFNLKLSRRRAEQVKEFLVKKGVGSNRLVIKCFGENNPLIKKRDEDAQIKNRRVEVYIEQIDESLATTPLAPKTKAAVRALGKEEQKTEGDGQDPRQNEENPDE